MVSNGPFHEFRPLLNIPRRYIDQLKRIPLSFWVGFLFWEVYRCIYFRVAPIMSKPRQTSILHPCILQWRKQCLSTLYWAKSLNKIVPFRFSDVEIWAYLCFVSSSHPGNPFVFFLTSVSSLESFPRMFSVYPEINNSQRDSSKRKQFRRRPKFRLFAQPK